MRALLTAGSAVAVGFVAATSSRAVAAGAVLGYLAVLFALIVWLPRAAHRAFARGSYNTSKALYKLLRLGVLGKAARAGVDVSLAACDLAVEDWERSLGQLERMDSAALADAARAAWLNNRAYARARGGRELHAALADCDQAIALRPDVAGFRHTRGVVLLALGRVDEAIVELDRLWGALAGETADEVPPLLEAERCYDLGVAWARKGERDYAADYFQRACQASPGSRWARRASRSRGSWPEPAYADLGDE